MNAERIVCVIEEYKFEIVIILFLSALTLLIPMTLAPRTPVGEHGMVRPLPSDTDIISPVSARRAAAPAPATSVAQTAASTPAATGPAVWPMRGRITTEYGVPHAPWQHRHTGIDITSARRSGATAVVAFKEGTVTKVVRSGSGYGRYIVIDHGAGLTSLYAHLSGISAVEGQKVNPGDPIGTEGSTGSSTGPHLHFEILEHHRPVNPRIYLAYNP